jgi:hypothetical protein
MHRKAQLSVQTRDWIERWSGLITDNKPALVVLLDQRGMKRGTVASTLDYLRKVADRKGISFYTQHLGLPPLSEAFSYRGESRHG